MYFNPVVNISTGGRGRVKVEWICKVLRLIFGRQRDIQLRLLVKALFVGFFFYYYFTILGYSRVSNSIKAIKPFDTQQQVTFEVCEMCNIT